MAADMVSLTMPYIAFALESFFCYYVMIRTMLVENLIVLLNDILKKEMVTKILTWFSTGCKILGPHPDSDSA